MAYGKFGRQLPAKAAKLAREIEGVNDIDNRIVSVPSHRRS
jgi:hypothetical protein